MREFQVQTLPPPTRAIEQALADLREFGLCVMLDMLDTATQQRAHNALYRAADDDRTRHREVKGFALDRNECNQRVWNLLSRDRVFSDLAEHSLALRFVQETLGWPALLSNISGNITDPGATSGVLHADQVFVPQPWPAKPQGINVAWCLDDFAADNGATEVAVGSHRLHRMPTECDADVAMVPVIAPAGSLIAFESRLWHRSGANTTNNVRRAAVFVFYTTPIYRTQENWFLSLDPSIPRDASETLLTLLAYKSAGFGLVDGQSPR